MNKAFSGHTYAELESLVSALARRIDAPPNLLPTYAKSRDFAHPHVEVDARGYHYVVVERGEELSRSTSQALDDLLYWIFRDVAFSMASSFEVANRRPGQDSRRLLFAHRLLLLGKLSESWRSRCRQELADVLASHPYRDSLGDPHAI